MKESLKISNMDKSDLLQSPTINDNEQGNIKPLPKIKDLSRINKTIINLNINEIKLILNGLHTRLVLEERIDGVITDIHQDYINLQKKIRELKKSLEVLT